MTNHTSPAPTLIGALLAWAITSAMALAVLVAFTHTRYVEVPRIDPTYGLPPCPTEDSVACYWDARNRGNGIGRSYTTMASGEVVYWD